VRIPVAVVPAHKIASTAARTAKPRRRALKSRANADIRIAREVSPKASCGVIAAECLVALRLRHFE